MVVAEGWAGSVPKEDRQVPAEGIHVAGEDLPRTGLENTTLSNGVAERNAVVDGVGAVVSDSLVLRIAVECRRLEIEEIDLLIRTLTLNLRLYCTFPLTDPFSRKDDND